MYPFRVFRSLVKHHSQPTELSFFFMKALSDVTTKPRDFSEHEADDTTALCSLQRLLAAVRVMVRLLLLHKSKRK